MITRIGGLGSIISDGRSGRNRNCSTPRAASRRIISDGRSGRNRNPSGRGTARRALYPMGDRGETATLSGLLSNLHRLYPMGDRGETATWSLTMRSCSILYPMGDRGETATYNRNCSDSVRYADNCRGGEKIPTSSLRLRGDLCAIPPGAKIDLFSRLRGKIEMGGPRFRTVHYNNPTGGREETAADYPAKTNAYY